MSYEKDASGGPKKVAQLDSAELHNRLRVVSTKHHLTAKAVASRAIRRELDEMEGVTPPSGKDPTPTGVEPIVAPQTPYHQMLTDILASKDEALIAVASQNIEFFHGRLKPTDLGEHPAAQGGRRQKVS